MKPIDFSRMTYADIEDSLGETRMAIWNCMRKHGPMTTRQISETTGICILTVRPRVTELLCLNLAYLRDDVRHGHEGVYDALTIEEAARYQRVEEESDHDQQLGLAITA
jgi:hypothetical protein